LKSYFRNEGWLRLNALVNIHNNEQRSEDNPTILNTVTLNDTKFEMWGVVKVIEIA
jgi:hypothetical protein